MYRLLPLPPLENLRVRILHFWLLLPPKEIEGQGFIRHCVGTLDASVDVPIFVESRPINFSLIQVPKACFDIILTYNVRAFVHLVAFVLKVELGQRALRPRTTILLRDVPKESFRVRLVLRVLVLVDHGVSHV